MPSFVARHQRQNARGWGARRHSKKVGGCCGSSPDTRLDPVVRVAKFAENLARVLAELRRTARRQPRVVRELDRVAEHFEAIKFGIVEAEKHLPRVDLRVL